MNRIFAVASLVVWLAPQARARELDRGHAEWDDPTAIIAELQRSPKTASVECTAISVHSYPGIAGQGSYAVLVAHASDGSQVIAFGGDRNPRLSRAEWTVLQSAMFDDRLTLQGRTIERDGPTLLWVEVVARTRADAAPRLGTVDDVLLGPLPISCMLELTQGRRMYARVLGAESGRLRIRTTLAEMHVPIAEIRVAMRLGCGATCRATDGSIDFMSNIPLGATANHVFASAAARVAAAELVDGRLAGTVIAGIRVERRLALILRTVKHGDLLVYLGGEGSGGPHMQDGLHPPGAPREDGEQRPTTEAPLRRQIALAVRLKRGDEVTLRVRKSYAGFVLAPVESCIAMGGKDDGAIPARLRDPEAAPLDRTALKGMEALAERLAAGDFAAAAPAVAALNDAQQRIALRILARVIDQGYGDALGVVATLVEGIPPDRVPPELAAAAIRSIHTFATSAARTNAARILGAVGCREGIRALEEASSLYGDSQFVAEAGKAIERIRRSAAR